MDSPIILLVLWFIINIVIKSAKDKKKIEESRQKRARQLNDRPINKPSVSKNTREGKNIIDTFREEIEKEINKEKDINRKKKIQSAVQQKPIQTPVNKKNIAMQDSFMEAKSGVDTFNSKEMEDTENNKEKQFNIDLKNDLLKGIIFSEILLEPKSIRNIKRSM